MLALNSARFLYHGIAAHAAAPDAVILMGNGIEFLREHVPSNTRIHYIISNGGAAPNVVPDTAELYLYARSPSLSVLDDVWGRILRIANGAAMMTDTHLELRELSGSANIIPNDVLAKVAQKNLEEVGGFATRRKTAISRRKRRRACRRTAPAIWIRPLRSSP